MELTRKQFEVLLVLSKAKKNIIRRNIKGEIGHNLGSIKKEMESLSNAGYVLDGSITPKGVDALESYSCKRAIFMAAGFGSRLVPITLNTPKPLVRVHGERIIDKMIDACLAANINEIHIVRGYLGEQFDQLLYKYPMIKFIENPYYNEANNISSAYLARHLMKNAYVFESDLLLANPDIISKYHYTSDVLGIWKEKTDDWCLDVDEDGYVKEEKTSGENTYQMVGIYYWNAEDGVKIANHLEEVYNTTEGKQRYWETVPNQVYQGQYKVKVRPCTDEDIVEIDTFKELQAIDDSYIIKE